MLGTKYLKKINFLKEKWDYLILSPRSRRQRVAGCECCRCSGSASKRSCSDCERRRGNPMTIRKTAQHPPTFSNHRLNTTSGLNHLLPGQRWNTYYRTSEIFNPPLPLAHVVYKYSVVKLMQTVEWNVQSATQKDTFVQPFFYLFQTAWQIETLVLEATAGSATTGSLELSALGTDIGPEKRRKNWV